MAAVVALGGCVTALPATAAVKRHPQNYGQVTSQLRSQKDPDLPAASLEQAPQALVGVAVCLSEDG